MTKPWFVYIVRCKDQSFYTGCTNDVGQRIIRHSEGRGARYTKFRRPVILEYSEKLDGYSQALKREAQIKAWSRKKKEKLIELWRRSSVS